MRIIREGLKALGVSSTPTPTTPERPEEEPRHVTINPYRAAIEKDLGDPVVTLPSVTPPPPSSPEPAPEADLEVFPIVDNAVLTEKALELTEGDGHGNALKALYILLREGVLDGITAEDYASFVKLYKKSIPEVTRAELEEFEALVGKLKLPEGGSRYALVRYLGDMLCDRGVSDDYTALLVEALIALIPVEIIFSNHDRAFFEGRRSDVEYAVPSSLKNVDQMRSMLSLNELFKRFPDKAARFSKAINAYEKHLKLLSYSLDIDTATGAVREFSLCTHAPVGFETLEALAEELDVKFNNGSSLELAATIDAINARVSELGGVVKLYEKGDVETLENEMYALYKQLAEHYRLVLPFDKDHRKETVIQLATRISARGRAGEWDDTEKTLLKAIRHIEAIKLPIAANDPSHPLVRLIENRNYKGLDRPAHHPNAPHEKLKFMHGHDNKLGAAAKEHERSYESNLGKSDALMRGNYYEGIDRAKATNTPAPAARATIPSEPPRKHRHHHRPVMPKGQGRPSLGAHTAAEPDPILVGSPPRCGR